MARHPDETRKTLLTAIIVPVGADEPAHQALSYFEAS